MFRPLEFAKALVADRALKPFLLGIVPLVDECCARLSLVGGPSVIIRDHYGGLLAAPKKLALSKERDAIPWTNPGREAPLARRGV